MAKIYNISYWFLFEGKLDWDQKMKNAQRKVHEKCTKDSQKLHFFVRDIRWKSKRSKSCCFVSCTVQDVWWHSKVAKVLVGLEHYHSLSFVHFFPSPQKLLSFPCFWIFFEELIRCVHIFSGPTVSLYQIRPFLDSVRKKAMMKSGHESAIWAENKLKFLGVHKPFE